MRRARTAALSLVILAGSLNFRETSAQNTYADVPFNQGSLFYRPSGAKPPKKPTTTPANTSSTPASASPRLFRWFSRPPATVAPTPPRYYAPTAPRVAAPTQPVQGGYYAAPPPPVVPAR